MQELLGGSLRTLTHHNLHSEFVGCVEIFLLYVVLVLQVSFFDWRQLLTTKISSTLSTL